MGVPNGIIVLRGGEIPAPGLADLLASEPGGARVLSIADGVAAVRAPEVSLVVIDWPAAAQADDPRPVAEVLEAVGDRGMGCMLLAESGSPVEALPEWVMTVDYDTPAPELRGHLTALRHCHDVVRRARQELHHMQRLGRHLNKQFVEVDHDMRLASRLQKEFLPQSLPDVPGVRFAVLYRPASWVSGDIYDIETVDEDHVSLCVADAVGHGMAASLLTIFVKQAICAKEIESCNYRILSPSETLQRLNDSLASVELQNSQYVTAVFCLLNRKEGAVHLARGGHPYPILVDEQGKLREIRTEGGLLGLFPGQAFPGTRLEIRRGQKLILYSDGMELAFVQTRDHETGETRYRREFEEVAHLPARQLIRELEQRIDAEEGSLNPQDDVTVVVAEMT